MALRYRIPHEGDANGAERADVYTLYELGPEELNIPAEFGCLIWFALQQSLCTITFIYIHILPNINDFQNCFTSQINARRS